LGLLVLELEPDLKQYLELEPPELAPLESELKSEQSELPELKLPGHEQQPLLPQQMPEASADEQKPQLRLEAPSMRVSLPVLILTLVLALMPVLMLTMTLVLRLALALASNSRPQLERVHAHPQMMFYDT
jgi:hypothetical protein